MRLRDEVDLDRLRLALVATADDAVRPDSASVWLRPIRGQVDRAARHDPTWGHGVES
jgi:hypothetical protein